MNNILNIETATDICSIVISRDGKVLSHSESLTNSHASKITILIDECLNAANLKMTDLAAVAISNGPGSYTSLRVGASTAKGICYALDIPMIAVDTLESLALAAYNELGDEDAIYCPMIDARRMEVYCSVFEIQNSHIKNIKPTQPLVVEMDFFKRYLDDGKRIILCGNGSLKCQEILNLDNFIYFKNICSALNMIPLSMASYLHNTSVNIAYHTPQYLKPPNITTAKRSL